MIPDGGPAAHHRFTPGAAVAWRLAVAPTPHLEVTARTGWEDGRIAEPVEVLFVGSSRESRVPMDAVRPGCVILHSHPGQVPLEPSAADLDLALHHRVLGAGFAIASPDASRCIMITTPPVRPAGRMRSWSFRLTSRLWIVVHRTSP